MLQCTLSVEFMKAVEERYLARTAAIFNACGSLASPVASLASGALAGWCSVGGIIAATARCAPAFPWASGPAGCSLSRRIEAPYPKSKHEGEEEHANMRRRGSGL